MALAAALFLAALRGQVSVPASGLPSPAMTLSNLGGGFALFALLWCLRLTTLEPVWLPEKPAAWLRMGGAFALLATVVQIALGGLVSAKFAALACPSFPGCGVDWPHGALIEGLDPSRNPLLGAGAEILRQSALAALHSAHRVGALIIFALAAAIVFPLVQLGGSARRTGALLALLPIAQLGVGSAAVLSSFPLALVLAHNAVAVLLLAALVSANHALAVD